ncbi:hypothetical protein CHS0354_027445 [Potamilus streckersoni]|uniref:Alkaline phosphatase n=1 Tax=Potamilus streckersoni TaxID=2493646 RepID=A0AAE0W7R3_9BIVA|nr:hypothetical protein CHS0354_027445 [Potamilus streckersoni]
MLFGFHLLFLLAVLVKTDVPGRIKEDTTYWRKQGIQNIMDAIKTTENTNIAKNIILFIGDGMGISTITAARILKGQLAGKLGEEELLSFEKLPNTALVKVYTVDKQVPDSAATATAILSGVKTKNKFIGVGPDAVLNDCASAKGRELKSILKLCKEEGKSTGIVTTARLTHATPAAAYAHNPNREWESDLNVPMKVGTDCRDNAYQLVTENKDIQVLLGGGRKKFLRNVDFDPESGFLANDGRRDGLNLVEMWKNDKEARNETHAYVWNKKQLDLINLNSTDYILGLFEADHMQYDIQRDTGPNGDPSLADMTQKAIEVLRRNDNGYFLLVEGGRIDHGHHANQAKLALHETLAFEKAVSIAMTMTSEEDTLLIVTADHSHVFTIAGYPNRGNDILGLAMPSAPENTPIDKLPYTTLGYANGPSYSFAGRKNLTKVNTTTVDFKQESGIPMHHETHGGEDVAVYSRGPMSHLLTGAKEQNYIAFVMAHSACVGNIGISCSEGRQHYKTINNTERHNWNISQRK